MTYDEQYQILKECVEYALELKFNGDGIGLDLLHYWLCQPIAEPERISDYLKPEFQLYENDDYLECMADEFDRLKFQDNL